MIKEFLRMFSVFLLLIIIIMDDFPFYENMKDVTTQLFLGLFIIACVLYDTTFGFIMGLVLIVIYYEIYKKIIINKKQLNEYVKKNEEQQEYNSINTINKKNIINNKQPCELNYISNEHLLAAQNNIFDINNFKTEVKGIDKGFNNEKVYGVQGLDTEHVNYTGFDNDDIYSIL